VAQRRGIAVLAVASRHSLTTEFGQKRTVVSAASDSLKGGRSKRWPQDVYVLALLVAHKTPYLHSPGSLVDEDAHIVSARHGVCCDVP
jgi:hypothetical protein